VVRVPPLRLVRPGRDRLSGVVEADETSIGGEEPGLRGGRATGTQSLVGVAVERKQPRGYGRCRMVVLPNASGAALARFWPRASSRGRGSSPMPGRAAAASAMLGHVHDRRNQRAARTRGDDPGELRPGVHRVASVAQRWLLGTHQGSVADAHLGASLDEFAFRHQPPPLTESRACLLSRAGTRRRPRPGPLPRPRRPPAAAAGAPHTPWLPGPSAEPGPSSRWPALEIRQLPLRLNGCPYVRSAAVVSHSMIMCQGRSRPATGSG